MRQRDFVNLVGLAFACRQHRRWELFSDPKELLPRMQLVLGVDFIVTQDQVFRAARRVWPKGQTFPQKPPVEPTSIDFEDYGYYLPDGHFRFFAGYDAKLKSRCMEIARDPEHPQRDEAMAELARRCWATPEHELAIRAENARKASRRASREASRLETQTQ